LKVAWAPGSGRRVRAPWGGKVGLGHKEIIQLQNTDTSQFPFKVRL